MASLNEIAFDLLSIVRPQLSDDTEISIDQIKFWVHNQRALWIRNELNRSRTIDDSIQQTLCVDLEEVNPSDCCDVTLSCNLVLRSTKSLPGTIEMHNQHAITRVGPVDKTKPAFSHIAYDRVPWAGNGRFNKNSIFSFLHNGYVYVMSNSPEAMFLAKAVVRGVFEDPSEAAEFKDCSDSGAPCYSDDDEYPIKAWMIPALKEAILKSNLMIEAQAEQQGDVSNNAQSDIKPIQ